MSSPGICFFVRIASLCRADFEGAASASERLGILTQVIYAELARLRQLMDNAFIETSRDVYAVFEPALVQLIGGSPPRDRAVAS